MNVVEGVEHTELMANLILTTDCQKNCSYCFAKDDRDKHLVFSWGDFRTIVGFLETSDHKNINLLGGEPTSHKDFIKMLGYLIERDFQIQVFTNGMVDEDRLDEIYDLINKKIIIREDQLYFTVQVNEEKYRTSEESKLQEAFFKKLGRITYPSFTIFEEGIDLSFLVDTIENYNLDRYIRLGLAMPVINGDNKYLSPDSYKSVAKDITKLAENSEGITTTFDCGFPLCMFSLDEIGRLNRSPENDFLFMCGQPLDIYPDLTVSNCYPLSKIHKANILDFKNVEELRLHFEAGFKTAYGMFGEKCEKCAFWMKPCMGGCKGFYKPIGEKDD